MLRQKTTIIGGPPGGLTRRVLRGALHGSRYLLRRAEQTHALVKSRRTWCIHTCAWYADFTFVFIFGVYDVLQVSWVTMVLFLYGHSQSYCGIMDTEGSSTAPLGAEVGSGLVARTNIVLRKSGSAIMVDSLQSWQREGGGGEGMSTIISSVPTAVEK